MLGIVWTMLRICSDRAAVQPGMRWHSMPSGRPTSTAAASEPERQEHVLLAPRARSCSARVAYSLRSDRSFQAPETSSSASTRGRDSEDERAAPRGRTAGASANRRRAARTRRREARSRVPGETRAKVLPSGVTKLAAVAPTAGSNSDADRAIEAASLIQGVADEHGDERDRRPSDQERGPPPAMAAKPRTTNAARRRRCGWPGT